MQIPLLYADAVIGTSGANISYIRRASGASIAIQETRGVPGEMTVEINGSSSQIQTAQQLIQVFSCYFQSNWYHFICLFCSLDSLLLCLCSYLHLSVFLNLYLPFGLPILVVVLS